jgi:choline dehydrogenase
VFDPHLQTTKSEAFSPPNSQQAAKGAQFIDTYHGHSGPVQVTYPDAMYGGPQQKAFVDTIVNLTGINRYKDLNGGTPNCVSITPLVCNSDSPGCFPSYVKFK